MLLRLVVMLLVLLNLVPLRLVLVRLVVVRLVLDLAGLHRTVDRIRLRSCLARIASR
jgi:hypothetical protein